MSTRRRGLVAAVAAMVAAAATTTAAAFPEAREATHRDDCPEAHAKVQRLEGRITPHACAFMKRQMAFGEMPTGTPPAPGDLNHPRVQASLAPPDPEHAPLHRRLA